MILAIDIGNTHVVLGIYRQDDLFASWRLQSDRGRTVDEFALQILALLASSSIKPTSIRKVIISCVVPVLSRVFSKLSQKYFLVEPLLIDSGTTTGLHIAVDEPKSLGADRIVNAVAAKNLFGSPILVIDFGTATTFDIVNPEGVYVGGIISPGLLISAEALYQKAALLPSIELSKPVKLIGTNTKDSMLSGIVNGYGAMVDGLVVRIKSTLAYSPRVIATGGLARTVADEASTITEVIPDLTLRGLKLIADMN